jgi:two-component system response regulator QseB
VDPAADRGVTRGAAPAAPRVLLVEDDADLGGLLTRLLREEGYEATHVRDGQAGLHHALTHPYDVLVIDRGLPGIDGLDLVARLRAQAVPTPVLVLTAYGTLADRVAGLDAGAEDYLVKPFEVDELLARLRALRRRHADSARLLPLAVGVLDLDSCCVRLDDGGEVELSARELALLRTLAARPRRVFGREELRGRVFPDAGSESIVDTYVYYLRRKLGTGVVRTVRGAGYRAGTG